MPPEAVASAEPIRLSICITTRNRARYLAETLASILAQAPPNVEVIIVDGASTDGTPELVGTLATQHSNLKLFAQTTIGGLDGGYDQAVDNARGTYCWLLSDDDLLEPDAVSSVLAACDSTPTVLIVDASVHNADFTEQIANRRIPADGAVRYDEAGTEAFFRDCASHLTFIGAVIVRRDFWRSRERVRYYGSEFIHVGVLFQAPIPGEVRILREPLVRIRHGLGNWLPRSFEVWSVKWPRLIWSFGWIDEATRASVYAREPWANPRRLLGERAGRRYGWRQFRDVLIKEADHPAKLVAPLICAALPWWSAYAAVATAVRLSRWRALTR
jgi:abequosyltransferase